MTRVTDEGRAPRYTERYLAVLRKGLPAAAFFKALRFKAGIEGAPAADFGTGAAATALADGQALLYERLGVAVIHAQPDQIAYAAPDGTAPVSTLRRERVLRMPESLNASAPGTDAAPETEVTWGLRSTGVEKCSYLGAGTRVCVLDSGIELHHPDIRPALVRSFVGASDDVQDKVGHGTHCAGTIAARLAPARGPRYGIACDAELLVGKVFDSSQDSSDGQLIAGINWAVENHCDIVSMSFGEVAAGSYSTVFEEVAHSALLAGTLLIASAGNDSWRLHEPPTLEPVNHPANCPSIMAVGAVDPDLQLVISSNSGLRTPGGEMSLVAPGANVHSAWTSPGLYARRHGTSMAVPFVAGIAALWAEASGLRGKALWHLLQQKARPLPLPTADIGHGLIQAPR